MTILGQGRARHTGRGGKGGEESQILVACTQAQAYLFNVCVYFPGVQFLHYPGEKVLIDGSDVVCFVKCEFVVPICLGPRCVEQQGLLPMFTFLPDWVVVQIVEKPIERVYRVVAPLCVVDSS